MNRRGEAETVGNMDDVMPKRGILHYYTLGYLEMTQKMELIDILISSINCCRNCYINVVVYQSNMVRRHMVERKESKMPAETRE